MSAEIYLTQDEREAVAAQRARLFGSRNCERVAVVLRPREDGEVDIVYAISRMKRVKGRPSVCEVQAVGKTASDSTRIDYRNLRFYPCGGYKVDDWKRPKDGNSWGYGKANADGNGDLPGCIVNVEVLAATKYRYAGIDERCFDIRPAVYLRALHDFPEAEMLFKAELPDLIKPAILKAGKPMARFIARNLEDIRRMEAGALVVATAFRRGITIRQAILRIQAQRDMAGVPRPKGVDAIELKNYLAKAKIDTWEYKRHGEHCQKLGLGRAAWLPAPRHFRHVAEEVEAAYAKEERRRARIKAAKERELERTKNERFAAVQAEFAALGFSAGVILAVWPRTAKELAEEGKAMHNCIGNGLYLRRVADEQGAIVFFRKADNPDKPWCDVELRLEKRKWCVAQCYIAGNMPAPEEAEQAADTLCAALNKEQRKRRSNLKKGA